jgi:hypothetical protein
MFNDSHWTYFHVKFVLYLLFLCPFTHAYLRTGLYILYMHIENRLYRTPRCNVRWSKHHHHHRRQHYVCSFHIFLVIPYFFKYVRRHKDESMCVTWLRCRDRFCNPNIVKLLTKHHHHHHHRQHYWILRSCTFATFLM